MRPLAMRFIAHDPFADPGLARELGVSAGDVTNYLAAARRQFRGLVLDRLRELTGSDDEFRADAKRLLGVDL